MVTAMREASSSSWYCNLRETLAPVVLLNPRTSLRETLSGNSAHRIPQNLDLGIKMKMSATLTIGRERSR